MKSFDYRCKRCGKQEERWVRKHDDPQRCGDCGKEMVKLPPATPTTWHFADRRK